MCLCLESHRFISHVIVTTARLTLNTSSASQASARKAQLSYSEPAIRAADYVMTPAAQIGLRFCDLCRREARCALCSSWTVQSRFVLGFRGAAGLSKKPNIAPDSVSEAALQPWQKPLFLPQLLSLTAADKTVQGRRSIELIFSSVTEADLFAI